MKVNTIKSTNYITNNIFPFFSTMMAIYLVILFYYLLVEDKEKIISTWSDFFGSGQSRHQSWDNFILTILTPLFETFY